MLQVLGTLALGVVSSICAELLLRRLRGVSLFGIFLRLVRLKRRRRTLVDPTIVVPRLVHWLDRDLSKTGRWAGQFGARPNMLEEKRFQLGAEDLASKPRLYLTGWPCFVLARHGLSPHLLAAARDGVGRLMRTGVIRVAEAAVPQMHPETQPSVVSYRHTIRALQILFVVGETAETLAPTLGRMFDQRRPWQNDDGGWAQCDVHFTQSDLLSSAYALDVTTALLQTKNQAVIDECTLREALTKTLEYFVTEWHRNQWHYGDAAPPHIVPLVIHEIASSLRFANSSLHTELIGWLKRWITPAGTVSQAYLEECQEVSQSSAEARLAYALHLLGEPVPAWKTLWEEAISHFGHRENSADVAFLIDMAFTIRNAGQLTAARLGTA